MRNLPIRPRVIFPAILVIVLTTVFILLRRIYTSGSEHDFHNLALHHTPPLLHPWISPLLPLHRHVPNHPPDPIQELLNATWPGAWPVPKLTTPQYDDDGGRRELVSPALVMLHIFSTSSAKSRARRALIRRNHPLRSVPRAYRHLVEVKFVLGYPPSLARGKEDEHDSDPTLGKMVGRDTVPEDVLAEEREIKQEMEEFGDIVRLKGLVGGDNMNLGRTPRWIEYVCRTGGREAWWVL